MEDKKLLYQQHYLNFLNGSMFSILQKCNKVSKYYNLSITINALAKTRQCTFTFRQNSSFLPFSFPLAIITFHNVARNINALSFIHKQISKVQQMATTKYTGFSESTRKRLNWLCCTIKFTSIYTGMKCLTISLWKSIPKIILSLTQSARSKTHYITLKFDRIES
jgi:hypothetical protein